MTQRSAPYTWALGALLCTACDSQSPSSAPYLPFDDIPPIGQEDGGDGHGMDDAGHASGMSDAGRASGMGDVGHESGMGDADSSSVTDEPPYPDDPSGLMLLGLAHADSNTRRKITTLLPLARANDVSFGLELSTGFKLGRVVRGEDRHFYYVIGEFQPESGVRRVVRDAPVWDASSGNWEFKSPPLDNDVLVIPTVDRKAPDDTCPPSTLLTHPENGRLILERQCLGEVRYTYVLGGESLPVHTGKAILQIGFRGQLLYTDRTLRTSNGDLVPVVPQRVSNDLGRVTPREEGGFWHVTVIRSDIYRSIIDEDGVESMGELYSNLDTGVPGLQLDCFPCWALREGDALCMAQGFTVTGQTVENKGFYVVRLFWDGRPPEKVYPSCSFSEDCNDTVRLKEARPQTGYFYDRTL